MAGLGGLQRGLGGLAVAQLADQDHVRVLTERAAERLVERLGVEPDLALVDDAALVAVQDLDRILDRDDVLPARLVDVADDRRERRRLAGAGGAGDEDEPAVLLGEALDAAGQVEAREVGHLARDDAEGERDVAALPEGVDAEARQAGNLVGGVELARLLEGGDAARGERADLVQDVLEDERVEDAEPVHVLELRRRTA